MEGILGTATVRGRVRQRADGVDHLDHGAGPAVGHDQRQRVLVLGPDVDEVDVHAVDFGDELRQRVQPRLDAPEVVVRRPVARQLLNRRQLHALRPILNELLGRPTRRRDASTEVVQDLVRNLNLEGVDVDAGLDGATHEAISLRVGWGFGLTSSLVRELGARLPRRARVRNKRNQNATIVAPSGDAYGCGRSHEQGAGMQGPLIFIATNRLKPGRLDTERGRVPGLVEFVEANEPRLIAFNEYVNEAGDEVSVVQVHPDAASMEAHIAIVAERARAAYAETLDATVRIQVFGQPSEEVLAALKQQAGEGVEITLHIEHLGGFTRVSNED